MDIDEVGVAGLVRVGPDVSIHLVPPRVAHRFELRDLMGVLTLPDRRMVVGDLFDATTPELVQPRVAHVTHDRACLVDDRDGEDARHAVPLRPQAGGSMDLVVRDRDRFPYTIYDGPGFSFHSRPEHRQGDVGRLAAGGPTADAVDDHEQAPRRVTVEAVLVDLPLQTGIRLACRPEHSHGPDHFAWRVRCVIHTYKTTRPPQSTRKRTRTHNRTAIIDPF